jgi:Tol biopolymer transport system component
MKILRSGLALAVPFVLAATIAAQSLDVQLQRAVQRETATGDHKAAIKEYRRIADRAGSNRAIGAQALLRLAEAHQQVGDAEANKVYEQILARFGDQVEIAALARTRLGNASRTARGAIPSLRRVDTTVPEGNFTQISPDGQSLVFAANGGQDLVLRDVASGRERTVFRDASGRINSLALSRDGKRIAFVYVTGNVDMFAPRAGGAGPARTAEIRVIDFSGGAARTVPGTSAPLPAPNIHDWSPDGGRVLASSTGATFRLFWLNVNDGAATALAEGSRPRDFRAAISPDGRLVVFGGISASLTNRTDAPREIHVIGSDGRGERVLSSVNSDLYPVGWTSDGRAALIVSRRSNTMGLWAFPVSNGGAASEPRLIQRDLCSCGELTDILPIGFLSVIGTTFRGDLYFQFRSTRSDVYTARLDPVTGRASSVAPVNTSRRGANVRPLWSPDGNRLLFIWSTPSGRELSMFTLGNGVERSFPRLAIDPFGVCWAGNDAFIYRRASPDNTLPLPGTAAVEFRRYDLAKGLDQLLFQDEAGFYSCSADGTTVAYRSVPGAGGVGSLTTRHLVIGTTSKREFPRQTNQVTKLSPRGDEIAFFEGLSQGPNALYRLVVAPTTSGTPQRELARTSAGEEFMLGGGIEGMAWSTDGRFVYYAKQLAPGRDFEVFRVPASGGAEQRLGLAGADVRELSISPDGSRIAFAMGPLSRPEIWAVQNVSSAK